MTTPDSSPADDAAAARSLLGPVNPVPHLSLAPEETMAARARVGMIRATPAPPPPRRGRFVVAGAVALVSVATLVAVVLIPTGQSNETTSLATGPGAKAVGAASAATRMSGSARALLTVTHDGRTITAAGTGDFGTGDARAEVALANDGPGSTITIVRARGGIYARFPQGMNPVAGDKPWVSVDAPSLARLTQLALGDMGAQVTGAPLDALTYLQAVSGDVTIVGPDTTRGEPTTHYRGAIDPTRVAAQLPEALRPHASKSGAAPVPNLPVDAWIDGQGRLRKLAVSGDPTGATPGEGGPPTITLELWDFGVKVDATPPPPNQVADVSGLLGTFVQNLRTP